MVISKYSNILVAVDGSEQACIAIKEAVAIAKRNEAYLTVLTVSDLTMFEADEETISYLIDRAEVLSGLVLKEAEEIISDDNVYGTKKLNGNPKSSIVQFAKEKDIDLIVMGSTGKGVIERVLIGSTTSYVVNHAPCNVLVVK